MFLSLELYPLISRYAQYSMTCGIPCQTCHQFNSSEVTAARTPLPAS